MKKFISIFVVVCTLMLIPLITNSDEAVFSDLAPDAEYFEAVTELNKISRLGYEDNTFRPESTITRAELITLYTKIFLNPDFSEKNLDQIYVDVPTGSWSNKYINAAVKKGVINGYGDGVFKPDDNVKLEEVVKIAVTHLMGALIPTAYPDGYIEIANELNITFEAFIVGTDAKRWQAAVILYKALDVSDADIEIIEEKYEDSGYFDASYYGGIGYGTGGGGGGSAGKAMAGDSGVRMESAAMADAAESVAPGAPAPAPMATSAPSESFYGDTSEIIIGDPEIPQEKIHAGLLTAGQWNDNQNWDYWNRLMANREWYNLQKKWRISTDRYIISVKDGGQPVNGAKVMLSEGGSEIWASVTDRNGDAVIFVTAKPDEQSNLFTLTVTTSEVSTSIENVLLKDNEPYELEIASGNTEDSIDLMLMIDTTGSMGDELQYIKEELSDVIERITADVRVSCNFYRDVQDEYIVRSFDFTKDINEAIDQIAPQRASGGGDFPEAVEMALSNAIFDHNWNPAAKERFLFLVLDAPPHHDEEKILKINECIKEASKKGIRIIPIASSGVDKETEFLLRSMSITTNGTYVFLTDHSGIGNRHLEPTIGSYEVEFLNDLIVKIINDRLS